jgi:hypothetical protein
MGPGSTIQTKTATIAINGEKNSKRGTVRSISNSLMTKWFEIFVLCGSAIGTAWYDCELITILSLSCTKAELHARRGCRIACARTNRVISTD